MEQELIVAIIAGLGGMLGWGLADFFAKKTIDKIGDVTTLFWGQLIGIIPLLFLFLTNPKVPVLTGPEPLYLMGLGIASGLSYIPAYVAFGKGKLSLLSPIFASYAVVVALFSALFLGEIMPINRIIAFIIVFLGITFVSGNPIDLLSAHKTPNQKNVKGLPEILLAVCLYSIWLIALNQFLGARYWVPLLLVIRVFSTLAIFTYAQFTERKLFVVTSNLWKFLIPIGVFDVMAFGFVSYGFSSTSFTSVVAMLSAAFSLPTIILARVFLKERVTRIQTIGSLVILAGVIFLSILS